MNTTEHCLNLNEYKYLAYKISPDNENLSNPKEVYPNPFTDFIQVEGAEEGSSYEIVNMQGVALKVGIMESNNLNLHSLTEGQYILQLTNESGKTQVKKVVKIR